MMKNQLEIINERKNKIFVYLIAAACFFSNISQLPLFVSTGMTQKINMPIWIAVLLYIFLKKRIIIFYETLKVFYAIGIVVALVLLSTIITNNSYFSSSVLQCLIISVFIYCLGTFVGGDFNEQDLKIICLSYAVSATLVSISIYAEYFMVGFDITSRQYVYASKNSISQIVFTTVVIFMFVRFERVRIFNWIKNVLIIFEVVLLMMLKSRATIIGFLVCLLYIILGKQFNRKLRNLLVAIVIISILALLFNENLFNMIVNNIMFAGRDASNLDSLTSGRISILSDFTTLIEEYWFTGVGALYYECFPLSCVLQFGVVTGAFIIGISYLPIIKGIRFDRSDIYFSILAIVCIGYGINSFFEGLAPIGPGVKCYFMWLMYGILYARKIQSNS